jgi:SAM-dependent methyltransferase
MKLASTDSCPFCRSQKAIYIKNVNNVNLFECTECSLQFFSPRVFDTQIYEGEKVSSIYSDYHNMRTKPTMWLIELIKVLKKTNFSFKHKLILEIGAGDALNFSYLSKEFGIDANQYEILELDSKSVATAKKRGITKAYNQLFNEEFANKKIEQYDVLIITEVIEHQDDLKTFLENAKKVLKLNGQILITTPNRLRVFLFMGERTDAPPHHFIRYTLDFFYKNFNNTVNYAGYYYFNHATIIDYSKAVSKSKFKTKALWLVFYPLYVLKAILGKLLSQGEGLVVILNK